MILRLDVNGKTRMKAVKEHIEETINLIIPLSLRYMLESVNKKFISEKNDS